MLGGHFVEHSISRWLAVLQHVGFVNHKVVKLKFVQESSIARLFFLKVCHRCKNHIQVAFGIVLWKILPEFLLNFLSLSLTPVISVDRKWVSEYEWTNGRAKTDTSQHLLDNIHAGAKLFKFSDPVRKDWDRYYNQVWCLVFGWLRGWGLSGLIQPRKERNGLNCLSLKSKPVSFWSQ